MLRKSKWIGRKLKEKAAGGKLSKKVLHQKLRTLKIKEGISQGIPRCSMKLLLVREGLGHMMPWFTKAGYDIVDMYKRYTDGEINFILMNVERTNKIELTAEDRVLL